MALLRDRLPDGVVLLTGTGIVAPSEVRDEPPDEVEISIAGLGSRPHGLYRLPISPTGGE